jgi:hypothetical protein
MRRVEMNEFKKVGAGAGLFAAGSGVNYHFNPGEAQLHLAVAAAIVTMVIFAAEGIARVVAYLATTAVELWVKVFTTMHDQRAREREAADRQLARTMSGREPPDDDGAARDGEVAGLVGSAWENGREEEEQRDRRE